MSRIPRPNPPVEVRCQVALRQLGEMFPNQVIDEHPRDLGKLLASLLARLAPLLGCEVSDLRLDHTWALENRPKQIKSDVHVDYYPPANDPEWLAYRPQGTQFAGSHDTKTRIRGDNGQLSDNALAKKERRRLHKLDPNRRRSKIKSRGFKKELKRKWPNRSFR